MNTIIEGTIILIHFPFSDGISYKPRPALVLKDTHDTDYIVCRITSVTPFPFTLNDYEILNWQSAGLLKPSYVRLHKLITINERVLFRTIGSLDNVDFLNVSAKTSNIFL